MPINSSRPEWTRIVVLLLLGVVLLLLGLGSRPLWDIDEGMHAVTPRVMVQTGDWLAPTFNGEPFHDKPPLYNWLVAVSFVLLGYTEFAARLPGALLGLATVFLTYLSGRRLLGPPAAFLGAVVLLCSLEFVVLSRAVMYDIVLAFFVTLALFAWYRAYTDQQRRGRFLMLMYGAIGLGVLAKGPLGVVIPGGVVFVFLLLRRDLRFLLRMMLVRGTLVVLALALPWNIAMALRDPEYLRYFLLQQNLGNFASAAAARHPEPFYYYVVILLVGFFPWVCYLPAAIAQTFRRGRPFDPARLFLLCWFGFVLLFFSAATSKLAPYVLLLFPPVALLVGDLWNRIHVERGGRLHGAMLACQGFLLLLVGGLLVLLWRVAPANRGFDPELHGPHLLALTLILAPTVLLSSILLWRRAYRGQFAVTAALVVAFLFYLFLFIAPGVNPLRSAKAIVPTLESMLEPGEKIVFYKRLKDSAMFYTDREAIRLDAPEELAEHLRRGGAPCVVDTKFLDEIEPLSPLFRVVERQGNAVIIEASSATGNEP